MSIRRSVKINIATKLKYYSNPSFLIIGAQKAGTSALFEYLSSHPDIVAPQSKELHFFDNDDLYHNKDYNWYHSFFPWPHQLSQNRITFEATPNYLYHNYCAERIYKYNPEIKLIIAIREPVQRAYSAWNMYSSFKHNKKEYAEWRSFEEVVDEELLRIESNNFNDDLKGIVRRGIYHEQLTKYLNYFKKNQLFIFEDIELKQNPNQLLSKLTKFLGLNDHIFVSPEKTRLHVGNYNNSISTEYEDKLCKFYTSHNRKLFELIGNNFEWNY